MNRETLPDRRRSVTTRVRWQTDTGDRTLMIGAGFYGDGRLSECWYSDGLRTGSDMLATVQDACRVLSIALQHGVPLTDLAHTLGMDEKGRPSSVIGVVVQSLVQGERDGWASDAQ